MEGYMSTPVINRYQNPFAYVATWKVEHHPNFKNVEKKKVYQIFDREPSIPFIIRKSEKRPGVYALNIHPAIQEADKKCWHFRIISEGFKLSSLGIKTNQINEIFRSIELTNLNIFKSKVDNFFNNIQSAKKYLSFPIIDFCEVEARIHKLRSYLDAENEKKVNEKIDLHIAFLLLCSPGESVIIEKLEELIKLKESLIGTHHDCRKILSYNLNNFILKKINFESTLLKACLEDPIRNQGELEQIQQKIRRIIKELKTLKILVEKWDTLLTEGYLDNDFSDQINNTISTGKRGLENASKLFSPKFFHGLCSSLRAKYLLKNQMEGSYLIREGVFNKEIRYMISFVKNKQVFHREFKAFLGMRNRNVENYMNDYLKKIHALNPAYPLSNQPLDHVEAQLEWNAAGLSKKDLFLKIIPGNCFITKKGTGKYNLYSMKSNFELKKHPIEIKNGMINCLIGKIEIKSNSLYSLIERHFENSKLVYPKKNVKIMEHLYYRIYLPFMEKNELQWMKASRQTYPFLHRSLWVNNKGAIYEQRHKSDFVTSDGIPIPPEDKNLKGKGGFKRVYGLKPFYPEPFFPPMVRSRFYRDPPIEYEKMIKNLSKIRNEVESDKIILPYTVCHRKPSTDQRVYTQIMPEMLKDLFQAIDEDVLSMEGKLNVMLDLGQAILSMHEKGWVHRDIKPENIMLTSLSADYPEAKLLDFDFMAKLTNEKKSVRKFGTFQYADPTISQGRMEGLEEAKISDQFGFGATLYHVFTGFGLRADASLLQLKSWVKEEDLDANELFKFLHSEIKEIVKSCCLGDVSGRPYRLPEFVAKLGKLSENGGVQIIGN